MAQPPSSFLGQSFRTLLGIRIRLIPLLIGMASMMLTVKVSHFWNTVKTSSSLQVTQALAEKKETAATDTKKGDKKEASASKKAKKKANPSEAFDILSLTTGQVDVLQSLASRRDELNTRELSIKDKENILLAIEKRLDEKAKALKELEGKLQAILKTHKEKQAATTKRLVKMYESMDPAIAAPIMEGLELDTLLDLMENFKEVKASLILANMSPKKARFITNRLVHRRDIPKELLQPGALPEKSGEATTP